MRRTIVGLAVVAAAAVGAGVAQAEEPPDTPVCDTAGARTLHGGHEAVEGAGDSTGLSAVTDPAAGVVHYQGEGAYCALPVHP